MFSSDNAEAVAAAITSRRSVRMIMFRDLLGWKMRRNCISFRLNSGASEAHRETSREPPLHGLCHSSDRFVSPTNATGYVRTDHWTRAPIVPSSGFLCPIFETVPRKGDFQIAPGGFKPSLLVFVL